MATKEQHQQAKIEQEKSFAEIRQQIKDEKQDMLDLANGKITFGQVKGKYYWSSLSPEDHKIFLILDIAVLREDKDLIGLLLAEKVKEPSFRYFLYDAEAEFQEWLERTQDKSALKLFKGIVDSELYMRMAEEGITGSCNLNHLAIQYIKKAKKNLVSAIQVFQTEHPKP